MKDKLILSEWCVVCSKPFNPKLKTIVEEYAGTCPSCRKTLMDEAPGVPLYGTSWGGTVEHAIEELEFRIPDLFNGPECPLEHGGEPGQGCSCTYKTGCTALKTNVKLGRLPYNK